MASAFDTIPAQSQSRQPAVLVVGSAAAGIAWDRLTDGTWRAWIWMGVGCLLAWCLAHAAQRARIGSLALCGLACALGGAWHHVWWNAYPADDISRFARPFQEPVRMRGTIDSEPRWIVAPQFDLFEATPRGIRSRLVVAIDAIQSGPDWKEVSGCLPVYVEGQLSGFTIDDRVELVGEWKLNPSAGNPGALDLYELGRSERMLCTCSVRHPDAVWLRARPAIPGWRRMTARVRQAFDQFLWRSLDPANAALGSGILLGMREQLDEAEKLNYLATGTTHLLAISGLHVGILASGILFLGSVGILSRRRALWLTIAFVGLYASLVEFQPTVTRAAILVSVWCFARIGGRAGLSFNALAVAGWVVLALNPSQLFQIGAQLSFLAVGTLSATASYLRTSPESDPLRRLIEQARPWYATAAIVVSRRMIQAFVISGLIWLVALPLVVYRFHILAPVALVANPILMIPLAVALLSGFLFLTIGWWVPGAAGILGLVLNESLSAIRWIVSTCSEFPGSYWWSVGPELSFVVGFYLLVMGWFACPPWRLPGRWAVSLAALTIALGWFLPAARELALQQQRTDLTMIAADVGHGGCALLKLPGGQHVVFDAGSDASPSTTAKTIAALLWRERVYHVDGLFISHADLDHYNAVDRLAGMFSIGAVFVPPSILREPVSPMRELVGRLRRRGIPVRVAVRGNEVVAGDRCTGTMLQPSPNIQYSSDNAESIVLEIDYLGQRILLTGDIESEGLESLLRLPSRTHRLVLAPHHGSLNNAPALFVPWSRTRAVVVCEDWKPPEEQDLSLFGRWGAAVYLTGRDGAVRLQLSEARGEGELRTWRQRPWRNPSWH